MIVVDANVLLAFLAPSEDEGRMSQALLLDPDWVAPPILRSEVRNALATMIRRKIIGLEAALLMMEKAEEILAGNEIPVRSVDVLALAGQSACTAYDCEYVALARAMRVPLVTWDKEILAAFPKNAVAPEAFIRG